jgi:hypothetical protein
MSALRNLCMVRNQGGLFADRCWGTFSVWHPTQRTATRNSTHTSISAIRRAVANGRSGT